MTQTNGSKYAPGYDLFKLIVAVILTIILILLLLRESQQRFTGLNLMGTASSPTEEAVSPTTTLQPPAALTPSITSSPTKASISPPTETSTPTPLPPSTELIPTEPTLIEPTPTESIPIEPPPPAVPVPTESTPLVDSNECPSNPTRIRVGATVRVLDWLNFRIGPGLASPIQRTNRPGTELDVIGGPVCTIRGTGNDRRAYLWWNVRMKDGREGWSAEAPLNFPNYFLEPIQ